MDYERADRFLSEFQDLADRANQRQDLVYEYWKDHHWLGLDRELQGRLDAVRTLAEAILPGTSHQIGPDRGMGKMVWGGPLAMCDRLRGSIAHRTELEEILGPSGPRVSAANLHHWVWEEASSAWDAGLRRAAVQAAAARVDRECQVKIRRTDLSGVDLARQAWSHSDPEPGKARLRPLGFGGAGSKDYESALTGSRDFHAGAMARIRNLVTHSVDELDEQEALEQLAALSVLARWIDVADVVDLEP